ncbi:MAG: hypothetical protein HY744_08140 [Deltaproteobacteria bacterium]|nr:hypothetical protein [Deltaproteobacteria bacterium]
MHCGACFHACLGPGQACCGGTCFNLASDPNNCGACGTACPSNQACCSGNCVNLQNDEHNCGACGNECPPGKLCVGGACTCPAPFLPCDDNKDCVAHQSCNPTTHCCECIMTCNKDADCPLGPQGQGLACNQIDHCCDIACLPDVTCTSSAECPKGQFCVNHCCVTLGCYPGGQGDLACQQFLSSRCGAQYDQFITCCAVAPGSSLGHCLDTCKDPLNCGGCGTTCCEYGPGVDKPWGCCFFPDTDAKEPGDQPGNLCAYGSGYPAGCIDPSKTWPPGPWPAGSWADCKAADP